MVTVKGLEQFKSKFPDFQGRRFVVIPLMGICGTLFGLSIQLLFDFLSRMVPKNQFLIVIEPISPLVGIILVMGVSFFLISRIWRNKDPFLAENKVTAYQRLVLPGFFGINMMISVLIHSFVPFVNWGPDPLNPITTYLGSSLLAIYVELGFFSRTLFWIRNLLSLLFVLFGLVSVGRTLFVFGIDYMGLVYTIYPEESELQNHEIYDIVRHPAYSVLMLIAIAAFVLRLSWYSLLTVFLVRIFLHFHLAYFEEKELLERFGQEYKNYIDTTPAFFPRMSRIGAYVRFVLGLEINSK